MRLLIIHQYYLGKNDPGGSRFNQFVKYWSNKGHQITVIAGTVHYATGKKEDKYKGKWVVKEVESDNVTVYRTYVYSGYNVNFVGRLWGYLSFMVSATWAGLLSGKQDLILVTSPPLFVGVSGYILSRLKRIPYVFEVRDLWPESAVDTGVLTNKYVIKLAYILEGFIYKTAKLINVLTPAFRETLIKKKSVSPGKITMIPNGADLDIFHPGVKNNWVREKYNLKDKFVIMYIGAHGVANNLITIIQVAEKLKEYHDIVFMLIGDGMQKEMLVKEAAGRGLDNVIFVESQPKEKVVDFCNAADVCTAVLKKVDTFKTVYPNKVFDYMSSAKPIILAIDGVARELVEKAQAGIYVEPENVDQFKEAVLHLYNNRHLLDKLGENGYQYVKKHFSRYVLSEEYEKILTGLVNEA